uniref:Uncharacterized protein n=1 Tax=Panagrellus redivivus TaxID=6233 RepID=A0A7E4ZZ87_PANRE
MSAGSTLGRANNIYAHHHVFELSSFSYCQNIFEKRTQQLLTNAKQALSKQPSWLSSSQNPNGEEETDTEEENIIDNNLCTER